MNDLCYASVTEIHKLFIDKKLTVRELVLNFISKIAEIDACDNGLNSVLEINPDALFIADALDKKLETGEDLPPLFGIPVLLKDNINTADKMHTCAGSVALADNYAPYDAHIAGLLRKAGAVILGKSNMTEFANWMTSGSMPSGYSSRGGQVINPYNRDKNPGGSSSGSGVAPAAGLCTAAIGTETSGSIINPAMQNGLVGVKPTLGLVSRSGIVPISITHDTAGPMARTVQDAAILLGAIAGFDINDCATHMRHVYTDYTKYLDTNGLKNIRIGINRSQKLDNFALSEEEKIIFDNLLKILSESGAVVIDNVNIDSNFAMKHSTRYEFKTCMNYYLSTLGGCTSVRTLSDIIKYNQDNSAVALKYGQDKLLDAENNTSGTMTEPDYLNAIIERENEINRLDKLFDENEIDIMLCEVFTNIPPFTGFPCMTIPIGQKQDKIPMGSYWVARRFDEAMLIRVTYAVEQIMKLTLRPEL